MTTRPTRIQRQRTKGWRMPEGVVFVGRGTIWGNPFVIGQPSGIFDGKDGRALGIRDQVEILVPNVTREICLEFYRKMVGGGLSPEMYPHGHEWMDNLKRVDRAHPSEHARRDLRGKTLACWCSLDEPCHADILIDIANDSGWSAR